MVVTFLGGEIKTIAYLPRSSVVKMDKVQLNSWVHYSAFQSWIAAYDGKMVGCSDPGFHAKAGDPANHCFAHDVVRQNPSPIL